MVELSTFNHFSTIDLVQADEFAKVYIPMNTAKNTKYVSVNLWLLLLGTRALGEVMV